MLLLQCVHRVQLAGIQESLWLDPQSLLLVLEQLLSPPDSFRQPRPYVLQARHRLKIVHLLPGRLWRVLEIQQPPGGYRPAVGRGLQEGFFADAILLRIRCGTYPETSVSGGRVQEKPLVPHRVSLKPEHCPVARLQQSTVGHVLQLFGFEAPLLAHGLQWQPPPALCDSNDAIQ